MGIETEEDETTPRNKMKELVYEGNDREREREGASNREYIKAEKKDSNWSLGFDREMHPSIC